MRTLKGFIILYDEVCPLCRTYTQLFVQSGLLESSGRQSYQQMPSDCSIYVDRHKAVNEIALVNPATGEVHYGIESLLKILGRGFPPLERLSHSRASVWILRKLYRVVSYNRRIIVPVAVSREPQEMQPAFHRGYRLLFLIIAWLLVSLQVHWFSAGMEPLLVTGSWYRELMICGGQLLFQGILVAIWKPGKIWDYLGNMMVVSLMGALALLPAGFVFQLLGAGAAWYVLYFLMVAVVMLLEHKRRCKLLEMDWKPTLSWVLYRILLLIIILSL